MYQGEDGGEVDGISTTTIATNEEYEIDSMIDPRIAHPSCGCWSHRNDALYCWSC